MRLMKKVLFAAAVTVGLGFAGQSARASDCHAPKCVYKTIVVYEVVRKPVIQQVLKYDHCGKPYCVEIVTYEKHRVPVEKVVKVYY